MPLYRRDRSRGRSDYTSSSAYGDSSEIELTAANPLSDASFLNSSLYNDSSVCYSSFGPRCGDWRLNATVHGDGSQHQEDLFANAISPAKKRLDGGKNGLRRNSLECEIAAGYGIDYPPTPLKQHSRSSRVRQLLKELLLGSRSRQRNKSVLKERQAKAMSTPNRASSMTLPHRRSNSPSPPMRRRETTYYSPLKYEIDQHNYTTIYGHQLYHSPARYQHERFPDPLMYRTPISRSAFPSSYTDGRAHFNVYTSYDIDYTPKRRMNSADERRRRKKSFGGVRDADNWVRYGRTPSADTAISSWSVERSSRSNKNNKKELKKSEKESRDEWNRTPDSGMAMEEPRVKRKKTKGVTPVKVRAYEMPEANQVEFRQRRGEQEYRQNAFVNSHEWTLSRAVSELHLGVIGHPSSGKTALIHRYLTGSYQADESPEGGRFKKEVVIDQQSHLLLIRDEGNQRPELQFANWADGVLLVFSVTDFATFDLVPILHAEMSKLRNASDLPMLIVGTKDNIGEHSPRVVTEEQGKRLAQRLQCVGYIETQANYGTNVERLFKDACQLIYKKSRHSIGAIRTPTPTHHEKYPTDPRMHTMYGAVQSASKNNMYYHQRSVSAMPFPDQVGAVTSSRKSHVHPRDVTSARSGSSEKTLYSFGPPGGGFSVAGVTPSRGGLSPSASQRSMYNVAFSRSSAALLDSNGALIIPYSGDSLSGHPVSSSSTSHSVDSSNAHSIPHLPTPSSTPTTQRKNRRISNIFRPSGGKEAGDDKAARATQEVNMGVGRSIPVRQGQLYKRSGGKGALNRQDWKKKFVTLTNDGKLTYHTNIKEYMENGTGKEVFLGLAAVRLPGRQRARNSQAASSSCIDVGPERNSHEGEGTSGGGSDDACSQPGPANSVPAVPQTVANWKKRRGHTKRMGTKGGENEDEECCFEIVTCDQKRWEFCAPSAEEREEWVRAIEGQIDAALQMQLSQPSNHQRVLANKADVQAILEMAGNDRCADCQADRPEWASLNMGTLICMECSGVHRNLGSHISKVRSLKFDDWPVEYLAVMKAIGNEAANRIWEAKASKENKPRAEASPEEREAYIRAKYVGKKFVRDQPEAGGSMSKQLLSAVLDRDTCTISMLLTKATLADVNSTVSASDKRTLLHIACSNGHVDIVQLLLWNNADMRALDGTGFSALWHARQGDAADCASVLIAAGLPAEFGMTQQLHSREKTHEAHENGILPHEVGLEAIYDMRLNESTRLVGNLLVLVPYEREHVLKYHEWMEDETLREQTASERLTLEEEYEMQKSWREDEDKLTFILLEKGELEKGENEDACMVGDVNIFIDNERNAECEVMIAVPSARGSHDFLMATGKGFGKEATRTIIGYAAKHLNLRLFKVKVFREYTLKLKADALEAIKSYYNTSVREIT